VIPTPRLAAAYLAAQGLAVGLWWALLATWPGFRSLFELGERRVLDAFGPPDALFAAACLVAARLALTGHRRAEVATGVVLGAVGYGTALTLVHVVSAGRGWLGLVAMLAATAATALCLVAVGGRRREHA
jgi:hypothetical protein